MAKLAFVITGGYITEMARTIYFDERKGYEKTMEFLKSAMCGTVHTEKEIERLAQDILLGRAEMTGNTADESYGLYRYDSDEEPELPENWNIWRMIENLQKELHEEKAKNAILNEKMGIMRECLTGEGKDKYMFLAGEKPERRGESLLYDMYIEESNGNLRSKEPEMNPMLRSFLDRAKEDRNERSTTDYGWLEPSGKFHEVEWGKHEKYAFEWITKNLPEAEWTVKDFLDSGDELMKRGWVLLHNPSLSLGTAFPTKDKTKRYTKAQKEFLYEYYMERNEKERAAEIWKEDEN